MDTTGHLAVIAILLSATTCLQWASTPQDGQVIYTCVKNDVRIPWSYTLSSGESINTIEWFYDGRSSEMIAIYAHNNFVELPAFSQRVRFVPTAGLELIGVTEGDAGNYSVELSVHRADTTTFTVRHTVTLQVADNLQTTDNHLHVTKNPVAVLDPKTQQWSVELLCGTFTYTTEPPFAVEWESPSGRTYPSAEYKDNHFRLLLPSPVTTGNYTCRIPQQSIQTACISGNDADHGGSSLFVDGMEARVTVLEAHLGALQSENSRLNASLEAHLVALQAEDNRLNASISEGDQKVMHRVEAIEARENQQVAFYAYGLETGSSPLNSGTRLVFNSVPLNQGNAYNSQTGAFNVPYDGLYFFAVSSGSYTTDHYVRFRLVVDGSEAGAFAKTEDPGPGESVSLQYVLHLRHGQHVWVISTYGDGNFYSATSSFSGFLISRS